MTSHILRLISIAWLGLILSHSLRAQAVESTHVAIGLGPQARAVGGFRESRTGMLADLVIRLRRTGTGWSPRASLSVAHFGNPNDTAGLVCNPDARCDYYAPAITLATAAGGVEWSQSPRGVRAVLSLAAYDVFSAAFPSPGPGVPDPRRGVRTTAGIQMGIIVPVRWSYPRGELELRYEWLAQPIESTRYFIPVIARLSW